MLCKRVEELLPIIQDVLQDKQRRVRDWTSKGKVPNFSNGDFVLVPREDFTASEKLSLRWRGPLRIVKALNNYEYQVKDLHNGRVQDVHASRLKFSS